MNYFDKLENNRDDFIKKLNELLKKYCVEPIGNGYIECIVQKEFFINFVNELTKLGIAIEGCSWWCYVNPNFSNELGCPHGMGGPKSIYFDGWYSELQNPIIYLEDNERDLILTLYNINLISYNNKKITELICKTLKTPFNYTPTEFIENNKCVMPALCLLVPDNWKRY